MLGMMGSAANKRCTRRAATLRGREDEARAAILMVGRNNLLLLDEPTNNLDPPSRQSVTDSLKAWKGTIVFVSTTPSSSNSCDDQGVLSRRSGRLLQQGLAGTRLLA